MNVALLPVRAAAGLLLWCALSVTASAQLIPAGQPIPRTANPPVVFLNGYQSDCTSSSFAATFGIADQVLAADGEASVFFDNCTVAGQPSIEKLGSAFGAFLAGLRYTDGSAVTTVDAVAHSMGGLILRSYLSGKQEPENSFTPPAPTGIRKAVLMATPNFGTPVAALGLGTSPQLDEISSGSHFLFDLNTWNDNTDDLRGIDALAVIGNGGTGLAVMAGFDDGIASLTSTSLGFYRPGRTRVLPLCHVDAGGLISLFGLCGPNAKGVAKIHSASDDNARILVSFLNGTTDWQSIGQAAEDNPFLSTGGGLYARPFTSTGAPQTLQSATAANATTSKNLNMSNNQIGWTDLFPSGPVLLTLNAQSGTLTRSVTLPPTVYEAFIIKPGPNIARVFPAAAAVFPLSVAPRSMVSLYGGSLAAGVDQARVQPLPVQLSDAQVMVDGAPLGLLYVSQGQINAVLPDGVSGLIQLTVQNSAGASTVNLMIEAAHPAVFTLDGSGTGAAAAIDFQNGQIVGPANPLRSGDYVELFLTGLGATTPRNGVDHAVQMPTVAIDNTPCRVTFAGAAPGFTGLDQINCQVPSGLTANPQAVLTVTSGDRTSNAVSIAVE